MYEYSYGQDEQVTTQDVSASLQLTKPQHLISLASSGVLVSVDVNLWSATKQDRGISNEITASKNADRSAGRYTKNLLADHSKHKAVMNYRQTIYNWIKRITYDWNGAQRYLPTAGLSKFMEEYNDHVLSFNTLLDEFEVAYDSIVSDMAFKQGTMFNRDDYPTKEAMRGKFRINLYVNDVPMNDYRCNVAQDLADDLFNTYSSQTERIIENIVTDQITRMKDVMESLSHCCGYDKLTEVDKHGEPKLKKRKIYDTTIEKAHELCESYKTFNLTNNAELEQARQKLASVLNGVTADDVRESDAVRDHVKRGVDEVLNKFGAFNCFQD